MGHIDDKWTLSKQRKIDAMFPIVNLPLTLMHTTLEYNFENVPMFLPNTLSLLQRLSQVWLYIYIYENHKRAGMRWGRVLEYFTSTGSTSLNPIWYPARFGGFFWYPPHTGFNLTHQLSKFQKTWNQRLYWFWNY
jgi:hypothetical protein